MSILDAEKEWDEVWKIYDLDKDNIVTKADFVSAIRVLGRRYTVQQMEERTKNVGGKVDYETFLEFMHEPYDGPTKADLETALRAFDGRDNGLLSRVDVKAMLTSMGDKLSDEEVNTVLSTMPTNAHGFISIDNLMDYFTPPVPSTKPNIPQILRELMIEELARTAHAEELAADANPSMSAAGAAPSEDAVDEEEEEEGENSPPPPPPPVEENDD